LNASVTVSHRTNTACTACSWNSPSAFSAWTTDSAWLAAALPAWTMFLPITSYAAASTATSRNSLATRRQHVTRCQPHHAARALRACPAAVPACPGAL
jgi:hypothetical protein